MPAQKLENLLHALPPSLLKQAGQLLRLQQAYGEIAPAQCARLSRVGALTEACLTLYADNGAIAAKLRQLVPGLLFELRKRGHEVSSIQVRVQVCRTGGWGAKPDKNTREISTKASEALERLASRLPPSPLRSAVERLLTSSRKMAR